MTADNSYRDRVTAEARNRQVRMWWVTLNIIVDIFIRNISVVLTLAVRDQWLPSIVSDSGFAFNVERYPHTEIKLCLTRTEFCASEDSD